MKIFEISFINSAPKLERDEKKLIVIIFIYLYVIKKKIVERRLDIKKEENLFQKKISLLLLLLLHVSQNPLRKRMKTVFFFESHTIKKKQLKMEKKLHNIHTLLMYIN